MKKFVLGLILGISLSVSTMVGATVYFDNSKVGLSGDVIYIDNQKLDVTDANRLTGGRMEMPTMIYNQRTYVPLRFVAESLDCEVLWKSGRIDINRK